MRDEVRARLGVSEDNLAEFCQRWKITELSVFGSVLRDDFGPDSDIDLLVRYAPNVRRRLADHTRLEEELTSMLGRKIDLCSKLGIEHSRNWLLKKIILESAELLYESR
ncbi:MAG: nucleotidyltransferase [Chloroflexi bacterium]|nr:nucleotidyltransferase [Chloroflexota bacterium]